MNKRKTSKLDDGQKEKLKQAAQQMTALVIGAAAGCSEWWHEVKP